MKPNSHDISQVLVSHIDQVTSHLCTLEYFIGSNSNFSNMLKTKQGQNFISFLNENCLKSGNVKVSDSNMKLIRNYISPLQKSIKILSYIFEWFSLAKQQLENIETHTLEFDIKWNNILTIEVCKIFVTAVKIILFLHYHPTCRIIGIMRNIIPEFKKVKCYNDQNETLDNFLNKATVSPFNYAQESMKKMEVKLSQLSAQIGTYLIQVLGVWPIVNWQSFCIFNRPEIFPDSTLPSLHHLILMNIQLLKDTVMFFSLIFYQFVIKHSQFIPLMCTTISECNQIYITRNFKVKIQQICETYEKTGERFSSILISTINSDNKKKNKISHRQRIMHITSLLRDIHDIASYDASYLPKFMYDILPLVSFGSYELNATFSQEFVNQESAELIAVIVELGVLFSKFQSTISRFFLFNLGTNDISFLNQMLHQFSNSSQEWQNRIISNVIDLSEQLQVLDLENFDKDIRYDMNPFIQTACRILYEFNDLKTKQRAAFLHPLFEHLTTIVFHSKLLYQPFNTFLEYCPIHHFWMHIDILTQYIKTIPGGIQIYSYFVTLSSFFNCDTICLSNLGPLQKLISNTINLWRKILIQTSRNIISSSLNPKNKIVKIVEQNRFSHIFDPEPYLKFKLDGESTDAEIRKSIWELKEFMDTLPDSIQTYDDEPINFSNFFATNLADNLADLLFKDDVDHDYAKSVDASFSAATQLLWPLYALLNISFPRRMIECRFENSTYPNQRNFLELISKLRNPTETEPDESKIIHYFEVRLNSFIKEDLNKTLYRQYGYCFDTINQMKYQADEFLSEQGFKYLIANLGIQAGFCLDKILLTNASELMMSIFSIYTSLSTEINLWYSDFKANNNSWVQAAQNQQILQASNEIIKLGSILIIRQLLRSTMSELTDLSIPGLTQLMTSAIKRTPDRIGQKEVIVIEALSFHSYKTLEILLSEKTIHQTSDPIQFFFFLGLLLINPKWNDTRFSPDNELLTHNLHVIPTAVDAFIHLLRFFCTSNDSKIIGTGMQFYFTVFQRIISLKMKNPEITQDTINALIILADLFPKNIKGLEYGRISSNFPYSVIIEAYREIESKSRTVYESSTTEKISYAITTDKNEH